MRKSARKKDGTWAQCSQENKRQTRVFLISRRGLQMESIEKQLRPSKIASACEVILILIHFRALRAHATSNSVLRYMYTVFLFEIVVAYVVVERVRGAKLAKFLLLHHKNLVASLYRIFTKFTCMISPAILRIDHSLAMHKNGRVIHNTQKSGNRAQVQQQTFDNSQLQRRMKVKRP
ncbi:MAG: hypothetical protein BYD32DRAFT_439484 [Podila humilis]|nr:MAG: hypothetical protein BYD32DRAFT_439484 [Podila humilis]